MKIPVLARRRVFLFPTLLGWVLILTILVLIVVTIFRNLADFLTVNQPVGADYLVIEAWMPKEELSQGLGYFQSNNYREVLLVGGPIGNDFHGIDTNYAERAAAYLLKQGLAEESTSIVKAPHSTQHRTFLNAVMVREWFTRQDVSIDRLDVFSSAVHTRRSRDLYQKAFGDDVAIGIIPSQPDNFDPAYWWESSDSGKKVAVEFANWALIKCCFQPGLPGSNLEK